MTFLSMALLLAHSIGFSRPEAPGRPIELPGLKIMRRSTEHESSGPPVVSITHPSMAVPQIKDSNQPVRVAEAIAPGMDRSRYVPGTTVQSFSQFEFFRFGKILFRPSGVIGYTYESNLRATTAALGSDHLVRIEPTLEAFIPVSANGIRLDYTMHWRNYFNYDLLHRLDHSFNADSRFDFSPVLSLAIRDHFALSTLDSREYLPGREIVFSDAPFRRNDFETQMNWTITEDSGAGFRFGWNRVTFSEPASDGSQPFYDYSEYAYGGSYTRAISPRAAIYADASYRRTPTKDDRNLTSSAGFEMVGGIQGVLTPLITGRFSAGFSRINYERAAEQNHRSLVIRGEISKEMSERSQVSIALARTTGMSNFQNNAYFNTQSYGLTYTREMGRSVHISVTPGYQRNAYPQVLESGPGVPGDLVGKEKRSDRLMELAINGRYRYSERIAMEVRFDILHRNSRLQNAGFTNYRAGISLLLGGTGITAGRPPY